MYWHLLYITPFKRPSPDSIQPVAVSTAAGALPSWGGWSCGCWYCYYPDYGCIYSCIHGAMVAVVWLWLFIAPINISQESIVKPYMSSGLAFSAFLCGSEAMQYVLRGNAKYCKGMQNLMRGNVKFIGRQHKWISEIKFPPVIFRGLHILILLLIKHFHLHAPSSSSVFFDFILLLRCSLSLFSLPCSNVGGSNISSKYQGCLMPHYNHWITEFLKTNSISFNFLWQIYAKLLL